MKSEIKKINGTRREISIEAEGEVVKAKFEEVFRKVSQEAKVPGFRPGKAPRDILEKHYSGHVHEQVAKELVTDLYGRALEEQKLDAVELPEISQVKLERHRISFKALVEVSPQVQLKEYKGIKLSHKKIEVSEEEVKRQMDAIKEQRKLEALDDKAARSLGYVDTVEMAAAMRAQAYLQKEDLQRRQLESQVVEALLKWADFPLPQALVRRQQEEMLRQAKLDLALRGMPREKIDEQEKEILKNLEPEAQRQVRVYLVLSEIAKKEGIASDDHLPRKVLEFLLKEAEWTESTAQ